MKKERLIGLGGWLILIQILIYLDIYSYLKNLLSNIFYKGLIKSMSQNLSQIVDNVPASSIIFNVVLDLIILCFIVYLLVLLYNKKKSFKIYYIAYTWIVGVLINLVGVIMILLNPSKLNSALTIVRTFSPQISTTFILVIFILGLLFDIAVSIILTLYILKSKRVRNTFVK